MSNVSGTRTDMSAFEAQFAAQIRTIPTQGQLRVRGWVIVLIASIALWAAIGAGIAIAVHALS
jgi:hypothetical protein